MKLLKNHIKFLCTLLILVTFYNCQQEDDTKTAQQAQIIQDNQTSKTVSAKDIPEVMAFIESKVGKELQFVLDDRDNPDFQHRNHEDNLVLTNAITEQITQVTNSFGKSNYTFKLIEEQAKEGLYFLNLIVKEYQDTFYITIVKYVPGNRWLKTYKDIYSFSTFTGTIYFYNQEGIYFSTMEMNEGVSTSITRDPCDEGNNSGSGNSGSGSTGEGEGESGDGDGNGSDSGNSSGSGGISISIHCGCPPQHTANQIGGLLCNCDTIIVQINKSMSNTFRDPCEELPLECYDEVGDPCPCNDTNDGCDNENLDIGINIMELANALNTFFGSLSDAQQDWINAHPELEQTIRGFLIDNIQQPYEDPLVFNEEAIEILHAILDILVNNPNLSFEEAMEEIFDDFSELENMLMERIEISPEEPIEDIEEYLNCFDTTQPAQITIHADQPKPNNRSAWKFGNDIIDVGHSFITISQNNINRSFGLYPSGNATPFNPQDPHVFGNNGGYHYDVSVSININPFQLSSIIAESISYQENYHLSTNNCTTFAIEIAQLTNFPVIPNTFGSWPGGFGNNPGDFGQDLRTVMENNPNVTLDGNGGNAPQNSGTCN